MKYIIANWKMNMRAKDVLNWVEIFVPLYTQSKVANKVIVAPTSLHIPLLRQTLPENVGIAAQDVSAEEKGAYTGEVGAFQINDFGKFCIVGHSERHESKKTVIKKRDICLKNGVTPAVCFTKTEEAQDFYKEKALITWEDPHNISHGGAYNPKDPKTIAEGVKKARKNLPEEAALIYGGSVNRQNAQNLVNINGLDGVLVGNASLNPVHFADIIKIFEA